jgi:DNA modification methylase
MSTRILLGDCRDTLRSLPADSVHCVVTSPPYFGLRDYGVDGQIGLEPTPAEFVAAMVEVFREVRRVLRPDGTLWLNLGDSYCNDDKWGGRGGGYNGRGGFDRERIAIVPRHRRARSGLKPKDRMMIPARTAIALQDDGWWLRDEIVWHKPCPMPSSVKDRTTPGHEMLYMLTKSARYRYDHEAIREAAAGMTEHDLTGGGYAPPGQVPHSGTRRAPKGNARTFRGGGAYVNHRAFDNSAVVPRESLGNVPNETGMRNRRSVWTVAPSTFREAHFATFPPALVEPCILAGCPVGGTVLDPFGGAGTTALVAERLQRNDILCELNPEYARIATRRLEACSRRSRPSRPRIGGSNLWKALPGGDKHAPGRRLQTGSNRGVDGPAIRLFSAP